MNKNIPLAFLAASLTVGSCRAALAVDSLENGQIRADFDARGLTALEDKASAKTLHFTHDDFTLSVGDQALESGFLTAAIEKTDAARRVYRFESPVGTARVVYELQPGWRFVSKQIFFTLSGQKEQRIHRIEVIRADLAEPVAEEMRKRETTFLRFADHPGAPVTHGLFVVLQNPFGQWKRVNSRFSLAYAPDMLWKPGGEPFASDRVCLGTYETGSIAYPANMVPEWQLEGETEAMGGPRLYENEVDAMVNCVRAFLLWKPTKSTRVNVGWCENDYQIDIATPEGQAAYQRIIDQAAAIGCQNILFSPSDSKESSLKDNTDAWGWENILWFTMGQKIRKGEWDPARDTLPPSVEDLVDYAKAKGVRFLAYVYPSLPFLQDPAWTKWVPGGHPGGYLGADTGQRSFQDWLLQKLVDFYHTTGASGYSFDHWWIAYDETPSSHYEQWDGCRRVLEELRRRVPDVIIDGRQQYHQFGVWTWLAGTYPHPLNSDEQPESFKAFPDLHWDRVSADRQRRTSYWYRNECFVPSEIMPGYMTHQTPRNDAHGQTPRTPFRTADWDLLGWKYSVISAIGTAPFNHIVNFIPARDEREFKAFSAADQQWLRDWFDWTDKNMDLLRNGKPMAALGPPREGAVDGWAAFEPHHGVLFLFNPNYRAHSAQFTLDEGLAPGGRFLLRQLYPDAQKGRLIAPPDGTFWKRGDSVSIPVSPTGALVLEAVPAPEPIAQPLLMGATGSAALMGTRLALTDVSGEVGTERELRVALPADLRVTGLTLNGAKQAFRQDGDMVTLKARFAGAAFAARQQIGHVEPGFSGGVFRAETTIPARIFQQLEARHRAWPVDYTPEEREAAWLNSDRLLLFINVADLTDMAATKGPDGKPGNPEYVSDRRPVSLKIDGQDVVVKPAYTSIVRSNPGNSFVGWYADVSFLKPDVRHAVELNLPLLKPGQFQGLFYDTVEPEYTKQIVR